MEKKVLTRPSNKHLDDAEIDALAMLSTAGAAGSDHLEEEALREVRRHVESCRDCDQKVQMHRRAQGEISSLGGRRLEQPGVGCPQDVDWFQVAAGLKAKDETIELMKHAAQCDYCGPLLREAVELLSDETTSEEEAALLALPSSTSSWRRRLAREIGRRDQNPGAVQDRRPWRERFFYWPRLATAAALAVAAAVVFVVWNATTGAERTMRLLSQAYTERRTLELRVGDAAYAPMRTERGGQSRGSRPAPLLEAETLIAKHTDQLGSRPDSVAWLDAKVRSDLLDWNYQAAIQALGEASAIAPNSTVLLIDSASAYFERAEALDRPADYGEAEDRLGKALTLQPENTIARYNRAIVRERLNEFEGAADDWRRYLATDHSSDWAREAQSHLDAIQQKRREQSERLDAPLMSPAELAARYGNDPETTLSIVDGRVEEYLDEAVRHWLPTMARGDGSDGAAKAPYALEALAMDLKQAHHDPWLADMLQAAGSSSFRSAVEALASAGEENASGNADRAYASARRAEAGFQRAGVPAGMIRAVDEELYALQRSTQARACVQRAGTMERQLEFSTYPWPSTQFLIEKAICLNMAGELGPAKHNAAEALERAERARYDVLALRATSLNASLEWSAGDPIRAFATYQSGLSTYWGGTYPPMRAYNFYVNLGYMSEAQKRWHLAESMFAEAVRSVPPRQNPSMEAMARTELAHAAVLAGDANVADAEFTKAKQLFTGVAESPAKRNLVAESEIGLAETATLQGNWSRAAVLLEETRPQLAQLSSRFLTLSYYATLGKAEWHTGDLDGAEKALRSAISVAEIGRRSLVTQFERLEWKRRYDEAYRTLVQIKVDRGQSEEAFELWHSYLAIPLMHDSAAPTNIRAIPSAPQHAAGAFLITYAFLPRTAVIWTRSRAGEVSQYIVQAPPSRVRELALALIRHCEDRNTMVEDVQRDGNVLYELLMQPLAKTLQTESTVVIEPDDVLSVLPFEALVTERRSYFGDEHEILISPGHAFGQQSSPSHFAPFDHALVVAMPAAKFVDEQLTPLPDVVHEARVVAANFQHATLLTGEEATVAKVLNQLPKAQILHFAGHAILVDDNEIALVLASNGAMEDYRANLLPATRLNRLTLHRCKLTVLSACATAQSGENGLADPTNLVRAFLGAGVQQVVASRWNVDSETTAFFMKQFYAGLLSGHSVPESIGSASRAIRTKNAHPFYWAAFAAFGQS